MTAWRLLAGGVDPNDRHVDPDAADGSTNMAVDAALLEAARDGAPPALRLYRWDPPTLSFGRNQPAAGLYDEDAARARGIGIVRRPTGGQAVLHADELTYAVVAPVDLVGRPRAAYRAINTALVAGLRRLGLEAGVAGGRPRPQARTRPSADAPASVWATACFRAPAAGEVVVRGRKLVGSAQRCEGGVVLQHGSILVSGSQAPAEELLLGDLHGVGAGGPGWTTLEAELGSRPSWEALVAALVAGWTETLGTALAPAALSVEESRRAEELRAQFASPEWTWRR